MEPKLPEANDRPEQSPDSHGQYYEQGPVLSTPERVVGTGAERVEQRSEATPAAVNSMPVLPPLQLSPVVTPTPVANTSVPPVGEDTPIVAGDDDLIEKEWVDKAKKIIMQTKDDPFRREQEVSKLQADYLRKRYGKELGSSR
jgi:hypothetical protein